jgi:CelD/BcsL family acetyltransferase involved in cellulose biosynthesis
LVEPGVITVRLHRRVDFPALRTTWHALERRAQHSFFQSWTWMGCLAEARFRAPLLAEMTEGDRTVGLALFSRRRGWDGVERLFLHESGSAELDCPYIEQNGVLAEAGREAEVTAACFAALRGRRIVVSGADPALAGYHHRVLRDQPAWYADLDRPDVLATLSANTRQQIRRSDRYFARAEGLRLARAGTVAEGLAMLDEMAVLHQASWRARGKPGSFAEPFFRRFHQALIAEGLPRSEVALLRASAGERVIGILYNFVHGGRMLAYQSGLAFEPDVAQAKPGLTVHHLAMRYAVEQGLTVYDFLAGDARYKRSLSNASYRQVWVETGPPWSMALRLHQWRARPAA